jgi:phosphoserine aminotransferase
MPKAGELKLTPGAAYLHITTNETIEGTQMKSIPTVEAPLVADMSSDILSRPLNFSKFGLIYAGAQKNIGPAGVTLVAIRKDCWSAVRRRSRPSSATRPRGRRLPVQHAALLRHLPGDAGHALD